MEGVFQFLPHPLHVAFLHVGQDDLKHISKEVGLVSITQEDQKLEES
jgi:hypothetical protein